MKKFIYILIVVLTFNICYVDAEEFDITAKNVILYNLEDNSILYEKDSNEKVEIASLTKIMTTIVALENTRELDKEVVIDSKVFEGLEGYATAGLKIGDKVTIRDLLYGVMLPSGADCVNAVINNVVGKKDDFIKLMNDKANDLGLKNTKFDNAIGMDSKDNYSSASDLAILLNYALKNSTFKEIFTARKYTMKSISLTISSTLVSYAGSSIDTSNILGAKSGFTDEAGVCLASIAKVNDINYLLVVLGSNTINHANAIKDSLAIYNYYGENYDYRIVIKKSDVIDEIDVKWGKKNKYDIKSNKDIKLYLKKTIDDDEIKYEYKGIEEITYKNNKGDKLGRVSIKYDGDTLYTFDVYLNDKLEFYHPLIYTFMGLCVIVMLLSLISMRKKNKRKRRHKKRKKK